ISPEARRFLLVLLAAHLGEFHGEEKVRRALARCPLVECRDGTFRLPGEVYFASENLTAVLGPNVPIAVEPMNHQEAVHALLDWLSVARVPRPGDVIKHLRNLIENPPVGEQRAAIQRIFSHLGRRWREEGSILEGEFEELKGLAWLPARGDTT